MDPTEKDPSPKKPGHCSPPAASGAAARRPGAKCLGRPGQALGRENQKVILNLVDDLNSRLGGVELGFEPMGVDWVFGRGAHPHLRPELLVRVTPLYSRPS